MSFEKLKCECGCEVFAIGNSKDGKYSTTQALCNDCQELYLIAENAPQQSKESGERLTTQASPKLPDIEEVLSEIDFEPMEHHASECEGFARTALELYAGKIGRG